MRSLRPTVLLSFTVLFLLSSLTFVSAAHARKLLCIDSEQDRVVLKRRCKSPRFTEVTPDFFAASAITIERVFKSQEISLPSIEDFSGNGVTCPTGTYVTGGGASISDNNGLNIRRSIPSSDLQSWTATVDALKNGASGTLTIYAICAAGVNPKEEEKDEQQQ